MRDGHGPRGRRGHHRELWEMREQGRPPHPKSAQTFRRGRAVAFLEKLRGNRATLQRQLHDPEFEAIKPVISGELKATEAIIDEFIQLFQLHEPTDGSGSPEPADEDAPDGEEEPRT